MRKDFEMTCEDFNEIMDACGPTPIMYLSGGSPMFNSQQENANYAWEKLGKEMGFKHMTVKPTGKGDRFFSAEVVMKKEREIKIMAKVIELFTINLLDGGKGIFVRFDCKNKMKNLSKVVNADDLVKHLREFADEIENDSKLK